MSSASDDDVSMLLQQWHETKEAISELESKLEKYKKLAGRIMSKKDTNVISDSKFVLKRRDLSKETIGKKDLPIEIWKKYSNKIEYKAYYLTEK
jgi:hypothetical protein